MMHDVTSDILVSGQVADKRAEIYRQKELFRDPAAMAVTDEEWIAMARAHSLEAQGGPAVDILPPVSTERPAPHRHDEPEHRHPQPHHPGARERP